MSRIRKHWKILAGLVFAVGCGIAIAQTPGVPQFQYSFNYQNGVVTEDVLHTSGDHGVFILGLSSPGATAALAGNGDYTPLAVSGLGRLYVSGFGTVGSAVGSDSMIAGGIIRNDATVLPNQASLGQNAMMAMNIQGQPLVRIDNPNRFSCTVVNSSATTLTAFGGSCAAPGASLSLYITDIQASASVISTTGADSYLELKSGTGGTCGTGTAVVWAAYSLAFAPLSQTFITPIKIAANSELCWMHAVAGSKTFVVNGFIAP